MVVTHPSAPTTGKYWVLAVCPYRLPYCGSNVLTLTCLLIHTCSHSPSQAHTQCLSLSFSFRTQNYPEHNLPPILNRTLGQVGMEEDKSRSTVAVWVILPCYLSQVKETTLRTCPILSLAPFRDFVSFTRSKTHFGPGTCFPLFPAVRKLMLFLV